SHLAPFARIGLRSFSPLAVACRRTRFVEVCMWKRLLMLGAVVAVIISVAALTVYLSQENRAMAADQKRGGGPELAHMVFFTLKDASDANREKMVRACKDYLSGHDGTVYFSAGTRNEALDREVNDKDYAIALHLVFK